MKRKLVLAIVAAAVLALGCGLAFAADYQGMIAAGDSLYAQRADMNKAKAAAEAYRQAIAADPAKAEGYWKLTRTLYWVGDHTPGDDNKVVIFEEAINSAKKAAELAPGEVQGHYWLGVVYGLYGQAKGILKSLSLVDPIKAEMAKVIEIDKSFNDGGAYRVLGRMYFKLPFFKGGDNEKSIENLKEALKYGPKSWLTHVYLSETYQAESMYKEAKEVLDQAIAGGCAPDQGPECPEWIAKAKDQLKAVEAKLK
ncbi:MAG: TRAP transporter TatT component family protein [Pseudomonadota bacterium]